MTAPAAAPFPAAAPAPAPEPPADGPAGEAIWEDATLAAALFAIDPVGAGGVSVRALPGPVRDLWLALLRELLPDDVPFRRVPLHVADGRLLGGLDLSATLRSGRPVAERGLLAEADGGVLLLAMAERVSRSTAAHLSVTLDTREVVLERDGLTARTPARVGVVALDEGANEEEQVPNTLIDRFAYLIDLTHVAWHDVAPRDMDPIALALASLLDLAEPGNLEVEPTDVDPLEETAARDHATIAIRAAIAAARGRLPKVEIDDEMTEALCGTALALGVDSLRSSLAAIAAARAAAALAGRSQVDRDDVSAAARLVLAPRATRLPMPEQTEEQQQEEPPPPEEQQDDDPGEQDMQQDLDKPLEDQVLEAAEAAIPANLLAMLKLGALRGRARSSGKSGAAQKGSLRGRPSGTRRGDPGAGARLNVIETLRSAAPWQRLRRTEREQTGAGPSKVLVEVRHDDFRVTRYRQRTETTTIFVVDASGSAALHRLAEAKGAVELLLADCYVRRDRVALIAFRGAMAELLLPPTRSLVRAKRSLAGLPGGGGTPLASALDAAAALADLVQRRGGTPTVVLLTDGRANVTREGLGGRAQATEDALDSAGAFRVTEVKSVIVDVSPRPRPEAEELARKMGGIYLPLPHADANALSGAVKAVS
jgi:magnesium chelatase subunit D